MKKATSQGSMSQAASGSMKVEGGSPSKNDDENSSPMSRNGQSPDLKLEKHMSGTEKKNAEGQNIDNYDDAGYLNDL